MKASCASCPLFTSTITDGTASITSCLCGKGFYESSSGACEKCIDDIMICSDVGTLLGEIKAAPGYWRSDSSSTDFIECPLGVGSCTGGFSNSSSGDGIATSSHGCSEGHEGFICATCSTGYYRNILDRQAVCMVCDKSMKKLIFDILLLCFGGFFIFIIISRSLRKGKKNSKDFVKRDNKEAGDMVAHPSAIRQVELDGEDDESDDDVIARKSTMIYDIESPRGSTTSNLEFYSAKGEIDSVLPKSRERSKSATTRKEHSVIQRLTLSHLQVLGLVGNFNFIWPQILSSCFSIIDTISSLSPTSSLNGSIECFLRPSNMMIPVFNILVSIGFLLLILTLIVLLWIVIIPFLGLCQRRKNNKTNGDDKMSNYTKLIISIIALFYISYSSMTRTGLGIFNCILYSGETSGRLANALDNKCFEGGHLKWVLSLGIPFTLIVVIGVPFIVWFILYRNRGNLINDRQVVARYGFLFAGYKIDYWYWEIVILTRKLSLVLLTVFLSSSSSYTQGLTALLIMFAALCINLFFNPYEDHKLNNLESSGLVCSVLTIYLGLWTFEENNNLMISWIVTVLVVGMNTVWFAYVLLIIFGKYKTKIVKFVNKRSGSTSK